MKTTCQNIWDTTKAPVRGKFIAMKPNVKNQRDFKSIT
jgi:hypothetical protein